MARFNPAYTRIFFLIFLSVVTSIIYWPVSENSFIGIDDHIYVSMNNNIQGGLTMEGLKWALKSTYPTWHPLTWLSHMADYELFGLNPGPQHLENLILHLHRFNPAFQIQLNRIFIPRIGLNNIPSAFAFHARLLIQ